MESEIQLLSQGNSRLHEPLVYADGSISKDQSGWGSTVKQVVTAIHEDGAACTVSSPSLTVEMEAVTFTSLLDCLKTTHS